MSRSSRLGARWPADEDSEQCEELEDGRQQRASAASPPPQWHGGRARQRSGGYRIEFSSEDSMSDGELHVERRAGSITAWYQRGAGGAASPRSPPRPHQPGGSGSDSEVEADLSPPARHGSVRVVLHDAGDNAAGSSSEGDMGAARGRPAGTGGGAQQEQQLGELVSWETNNLFEYLKGLYQQGIEEAQQGQEFDSEEWACRMSALRQLLRERDSEVAQLQRLLGDRQGQLEELEAEVAQQAQRIQQLEERIRQLLRQLEAAQPGSRDAVVHIGDSGSKLPAVHSVVQKQQLASAYQPATDSYFMQLPAQSYAEYSGCGFWQSMVEAVQHHPRRWGLGLAALLLLLLIILCATLIPAAQRRRARPQLGGAVAVAGTGASWIDLAVQLDRPGLLSYMVFRQADLNTAVPGLGGRTLMELIQAEDVEGRAVYAASAATYSLDPSSSPQPGLQQLAVACGWVPAANASGNQPPVKLSILSAAGSASAACSASATSAPGRCARCPKLVDATAYTVLLVAASSSGRAVSGVQVINAVTGDASVNVNSLEPPYVSNATATSFDLHFKLNSPGTLYYAVAYDRLFANYGSQQLAFGALAPPSSAVIAANPAAFLGGLVANGSVAATAAGEWTSITVHPPCVADLCQLSVYSLQGSTSYRVFMVAVDAFGSADPAPAEASFTTTPATSAPALLPPSGPANITSSSFDVAASMEAAGGVYYLLVAPKAGAGSGPAADLAPGTWSQVSGLPGVGSSRRRQLAHADGSSTGGADSYSVPHWRRLQEASPATVAPGSLVLPTCYPTNRTCLLTSAAAFSSMAGLSSSYDVVAAGCMPVPAAGQAAALPTFIQLQNNTLYYLLLSTEDRAVPEPNTLQPPAIYAVRTVDPSAPQFACGFPTASNITASSFALAAMLTKPGASAIYVVVQSSAAGGAAPTALEVLHGTGAGGAAVVAAGNLSRWGSLPWEAAPAGTATGTDAADPHKLWAVITGLQSGANYTAYLTITADGNVPVAGGAVAMLSGILTPNLVPPTFTRLKGLGASVDEQGGTFSVQLSTSLDRAGQVYYALYRNYSCIQGEPSVADIVAGNALPPTICKCEDASYCSLVTSGSYSVPSQTLGAVQSVGGDLSPLPFESLRNATDDKLKCFQGGLGQAADTYNIYLVAGNALPSYTGLAPQCSNYAQAAAVASAAAAAAVASGSSSDGSSSLAAGCPAALQIACAQTQLRPDSQTLQSGSIVGWPVNSSSNGSVAWQQPAGSSVYGRPAKVQLSLEGGSAPAFTYGPVFPTAQRTASSFGMQFALDKPALLIYAVFRPMPIDSSGNPQAPVLIATGRVPVFDAATNATTGAITACPWAPGGAMQAQSQYYVTYVARDKYGRMDGLCPGQQPGAAPRVCTDMAFTGG